MWEYIFKQTNSMLNENRNDEVTISLGKTEYIHQFKLLLKNLTFVPTCIKLYDLTTYVRVSEK